MRKVRPQFTAKRSLFHFKTLRIYVIFKIILFCCLTKWLNQILQWLIENQNTVAIYFSTKITALINYYILYFVIEKYKMYLTKSGIRGSRIEGGLSPYNLWIKNTRVSNRVENLFIMYINKYLPWLQTGEKFIHKIKCFWFLTLLCGPVRDPVLIAKGLFTFILWISSPGWFIIPKSQKKLLQVEWETYVVRRWIEKYGMEIKLSLYDCNNIKFFCSILTYEKTLRVLLYLPSLVLVLSL